MPWLSLPFKEQRNDELADLFEFEGIPHLVFVDYDGKVLCSDATETVREDPEGKEFPWLPKPVYRFNDGVFRRHILTSTTVFVKSPNEQIEALIPKLTELVNSISFKKEIHVFIYTETDRKESETLKRAFQFSANEETNQILLLNVEEKKKHISSLEANLQNVQKILSDYASETLEMASL
jgi:nucleoredoxin